MALLVTFQLLGLLFPWFPVFLFWHMWSREKKIQCLSSFAGKLFHWRWTFVWQCNVPEKVNRKYCIILVYIYTFLYHAKPETQLELFLTVLEPVWPEGGKVIMLFEVNILNVCIIVIVCLMWFNLLFSVSFGIDLRVLQIMRIREDHLLWSSHILMISRTLGVTPKENEKKDHSSHSAAYSTE